MPKVKILLGEIGTSGTVERFHVSGNAGDDIGRAVELEHACSDSSCDIGAALRGGFPFTAAYLLSGATETPLLDSVCQFYGVNLAGYDNVPDWEEWEAFHKEHGRQCPSCGSFTYQDDWTHTECGNCLASFPPMPDMNADAFISEVRNGYSVSVEGQYLETFTDSESAESFLWNWTDSHGFYPETWRINERGNTELLIRTDNRNEPYRFGDIGYV